MSELAGANDLFQVLSILTEEKLSTYYNEEF